jgi:hypothetical protein
MAKPREYAPSLEYLHSILEIKDGRLYNKVQRNSRVKVGELTGSYSGRYAMVTLDGIPWQVSRILFYMTHGYMPEFVDHIDGNKKNNHIDNLRAASASQNQANHSLKKTNISGVKGVSWSKKFNKWYACIRYKSKNKNLGYFHNLNDAKEFIELAREMLHGEFTNHGYKENLSCR